MKEMVTEQEPDCPFEFNFDPDTFKVGDSVSYRVESMDEMPFVGILVEVSDDYVVIVHDGEDQNDPNTRLMRGTRESRPLVSEKEALGD